MGGSGRRAGCAGGGGASSSRGPFAVVSPPVSPRRWRRLLRLVALVRACRVMTWFSSVSSIVILPDAPARILLPARSPTTSADTTRSPLRHRLIPPLRDQSPSTHLSCLSGSDFAAIVGYTSRLPVACFLRPVASVARGGSSAAYLYVHLHCGAYQLSFFFPVCLSVAAETGERTYPLGVMTATGAPDSDFVRHCCVGRWMMLFGGAKWG